MGWGFRKSVSFGPFRINASKSGIGASFGVKGARISAGPRGTYVNLGSNGFYYRKRIDTQDNDNSNSTNEISPPVSPPESGGLHTITTINFDQLTDVDSQDFINELESKFNKTSLLPWLGIVPALILYGFLFSYINKEIRTEEVYEDIFRVTSPSAHLRDLPSTSGKILSTSLTGIELKLVSTDSGTWRNVYLPYSSTTGYIYHTLGLTEKKLVSKTPIYRFEDQPLLSKLILILPIIPLIALWIWLYRFDKRRKTLEINYQMDESVEILYKKFLDCFQEFAFSKKIWQKLHSERNVDFKHNAGAGELVRRSVIRSLSIDEKPTSFLITNISVPHIGLIGNSLYFFPERIVMKRGCRFAALQYKNVTIEHAITRFIEDESVPSDTEILGYTWKYLNKSGGPDKRFKDNAQIPICKYSQYHLSAGSGLNEVITTSRPGAMDRLAEFIKLIGKFQENMKIKSIEQ